MVIFVLSFTACDAAGTSNINTISGAQLTDKEKIFLSVGSKNYFVFDFSVDKKYKWVKVWIDRYEHGNKVTGSGSLLTSLSAGEEGMIIATLRRDENMTNEWTLAINSGGALSQAESKQEYKSKANLPFSSVISSSGLRVSIEDKEIILGSACYKASQEEGSIVSSLSQGFYTNPEAHMEEIAEYDLVYLLKCRFYDTEREPE